MSSYTVTELNDIIKKAVHIEFKNKPVTVTGEVSNVRSAGKHTYLTLKDNDTSISVAFWGSQLTNKQGDNVEITGKIDYYVKSGYVNLIGTTIKNTGVGTVHAEFEKIKSDYEKKGYFNNKKPLPTSIKRVGVVTSMGGAALQDFLYVLKKGSFSGEVYIYDCIAQGSRCPASVAAGVKFFNSPFYPTDELSSQDNDTVLESSHGESFGSSSKKGIKDDLSDDENEDVDDDESEDPFEISAKTQKELEKQNTVIESKQKPKKLNLYDNDKDEIEVDLIVVTRGGGSFEDLMGFSHPKVIDAIYASNKYVISAVGHEIDSMLSDYVAHYRAPTPSIAGEVVCSINNNNQRIVQRYEKEVLALKHQMLQDLFRFKRTIKGMMADVVDPTEKLNNTLNTALHTTTTHIATKLTSLRQRLMRLKESLNTNDVTKLLECGFVILTTPKGDIVKDVEKIFDKEIILTHNAGRYKVQITQLDDTHEEKNEPQKKRRTTKKQTDTIESVNTKTTSKKRGKKIEN
ncbi:exodeoxyribonuclease VII large subunit [Yasminevirus sp. GU-2018]|uniref:Exodeoxyribonuclease VII large subunit n=1 Tax=Yasminevirus sp. GU-2018 TaxID=2420051 RepID=A0A5K0U910_9VIRU|nr:exodeoxyribonuclease VII large subunit [Yasminevirus sp. GU-2018]